MSKWFVASAAPPHPPEQWLRSFGTRVSFDVASVDVFFTHYASSFVEDDCPRWLKASMAAKKLEQRLQQQPAVMRGGNAGYATPNSLMQKGAPLSAGGGHLSPSQLRQRQQQMAYTEQMPLSAMPPAGKPSMVVSDPEWQRRKNPVSQQSTQRRGDFDTGVSPSMQPSQPSSALASGTVTPSLGAGNNFHHFKNDLHAKNNINNLNKAPLNLFSTDNNSFSSNNNANRPAGGAPSQSPAPNIYNGLYDPIAHIDGDSRVNNNKLMNEQQQMQQQQQQQRQNVPSIRTAVAIAASANSLNNNVKNNDGGRVRNPILPLAGTRSTAGDIVLNKNAGLSNCPTPGGSGMVYNTRALTDNGNIIAASKEELAEYNNRVQQRIASQRFGDRLNEQGSQSFLNGTGQKNGDIIGHRDDAEKGHLELVKGRNPSTAQEHQKHLSGTVNFMNWEEKQSNNGGGAGPVNSAVEKSPKDRVNKHSQGDFMNWDVMTPQAAVAAGVVGAGVGGVTRNINYKQSANSAGNVLNWEGQPLNNAKCEENTLSVPHPGRKQSIPANKGNGDFMRWDIVEKGDKSNNSVNNSANINKVIPNMQHKTHQKLW